MYTCTAVLIKRVVAEDEGEVTLLNTYHTKKEKNSSSLDGPLNAQPEPPWRYSYRVGYEYGSLSPRPRRVVWGAPPVSSCSLLLILAAYTFAARLERLMSQRRRTVGASDERAVCRAPAQKERNVISTKTAATCAPPPRLSLSRNDERGHAHSTHTSPGTL
jgi:hypothetical protein